MPAQVAEKSHSPSEALPEIRTGVGIPAAGESYRTAGPPSNENESKIKPHPAQRGEAAAPCLHPHSRVLLAELAPRRILPRRRGGEGLLAEAPTRAPRFTFVLDPGSLAHERIFDFEVGEPSEVTVVRDQGRSMLDRQGGQVCIGHQRTTCLP